MNQRKESMHSPVVLVLALATMTLAASARAVDTKDFWTKNCAKCHGPDGKGDTKMGKKLGIVNLSDAKVQEKFSDADLAKTIREGVKDKEGKIRMKAAEHVTEADIKGLVAHVRTLRMK